MGERLKGEAGFALASWTVVRNLPAAAHRRGCFFDEARRACAFGLQGMMEQNAAVGLLRRYHLALGASHFVWSIAWRS